MSLREDGGNNKGGFAESKAAVRAPLWLYTKPVGLQWWLPQAEATLL